MASPPPDDKIKLYDQLVGRIPEIERKGKNMPYTSLNGHMFSFLDPTGKMGLRLDKDTLDEFIQRFDTQLNEQHGRIMKEYALVPDRMLEEQKQLLEYLELSFNYVKSLKPKPTKKKA